MTTRPPTTPPTIAPIGADFCGTGEVVGVTTGRVKDEEAGVSGAGAEDPVLKTGV
jgi:hypothetical protein